MDKQRFGELAETYGADIEEWPTAERAAAQDFLSGPQAAWARDALADAVAVDALLAGFDVGDGHDADLAARIVANATAFPQDKVEKTVVSAATQEGGGLVTALSGLLGVRVRPAWVFAPGGGLMAAAVIGFFIGAGGGLPGTQGEALLLDPVFYSQEQVIMPDAELWTGGQGIE